MREPDRQGDERVRQRARARDPLELARHRGVSPSTTSSGAPFGEHDVLEQVHDEQVVERERVERRDLDGEHQCAAAGEADDPPAGGGEAGQRDRVGGRHSGDDDERVGVP